MKRGAYLQLFVDHQGDECVLWPFKLNSCGYGYVYVGKRYVTASRRMCELAHGLPTPEKNEAAHSCDERRCINPRHLRWASKRENTDDKLQRGRHPRGEASSSSRITEDQAREIIASTEPPHIIAPRYGISRRQVYRIRKGIQWPHLRWSEPQSAAA